MTVNMVILNCQLIGKVSTLKGQVHPRKCISAHSVKIVWGSESYYQFLPGGQSPIPTKTPVPLSQSSFRSSWFRSTPHHVFSTSVDFSALLP